MKHFSYYLLIILLITSSCVPIKIAPEIEDYKIMKAKKIKRKLPKETSFVFNDPKEAGEFYSYMRIKRDLNKTNPGESMSFIIDNKKYYLTYKEAESHSKSLNLPLLLVDLKRESNGNSALFQDNYVHRKGKWYMLLTVYDTDLNNCLIDDYKNKGKIILYLKKLKDEYLNTVNYQELLFKKKS